MYKDTSDEELLYLYKDKIIPYDYEPGCGVANSPSAYFSSSGTTCVSVDVNNSNITIDTSWMIEYDFYSTTVQIYDDVTFTHEVRICELIA